MSLNDKITESIEFLHDLAQYNLSKRNYLDAAKISVELKFLQVGLLDGVTNETKERVLTSVRRYAA